MRPIEVSAEVALPPGDVWDVLWGNGGPPRFLADMHRLGYWRDVTSVDDYRMLPDGMPHYDMSRKFGPFPPMRMKSEYTVFDRPHRAVNHPVNTPLRGDFITTYEPTQGGTRITWRWELKAANPVLDKLLPVLRPSLERSLKANLDEYAKAAALTRS